MLSQDRISLCRLRVTFIMGLIVPPWWSKPKSFQRGLMECQQNIAPPVRQSHVTPHIATQNMKITLPSTLQNTCQIDVHLWRNLLFLHRSWIYCTPNINDVPDMAASDNELFFTFSCYRAFSSLLIQRKRNWHNTFRWIQSPVDGMIIKSLFQIIKEIMSQQHEKLGRLYILVQLTQKLRKSLMSPRHFSLSLFQNSFLKCSLIHERFISDLPKESVKA